MNKNENKGGSLNNLQGLRGGRRSGEDLASDEEDNGGSDLEEGEAGDAEGNDDDDDDCLQEDCAVMENGV